MIVTNVSPPRGDVYRLEIGHSVSSSSRVAIVLDNFLFFFSVSLDISKSIFNHQPIHLRVAQIMNLVFSEKVNELRTLLIIRIVKTISRDCAQSTIIVRVFLNNTTHE